MSRRSGALAISLLMLFIPFHQALSVTHDPCAKISIIAHEGLSGRSPEESKAAFQLATTLNADTLSLTVQRSKDHVLILNSDETFERTTNIAEVFPKRIKDKVSSFTYKEISQLETGRAFNKMHEEFANSHFIGQKIARFEDIIDLVIGHKNHPGLLIETAFPEDHPGYEREILALLDKKEAFDNFKVTFQSYSTDSLNLLKELRPEVPRIYLTGAVFRDLIKTELDQAEKSGSGISADFAMVPRQNLKDFLDRAHAKKLAVHLRTVDEPGNMKLLIELGVDGIHSNRLDLLVQQCERMKKAEVEPLLQKVIGGQL